MSALGKKAAVCAGTSAYWQSDACFKTSALSVGERQHSAMRIDDGLGDAEAKARTAGLAVPRRLPAIEGAADAIELLRRKARAAIEDSDRHSAALSRDRHLRRTRIFQRIVDKVPDRPSDEVGLDGDFVRSVGREFDPVPELAIFLGD